jgi:hypothetical protein
VGSGESDARIVLHARMAHKVLLAYETCSCEEPNYDLDGEVMPCCVHPEDDPEVAHEAPTV